MHAVCASFVLFWLKSSIVQLYNHYRIIVEENSVKYVPLDIFLAFRFYQIQFRPVPAGGAYDAPPDPLVGSGGEHPVPIPQPVDAYGVSPTVPHHFSKPSAAFLLSPRQ